MNLWISLIYIGLLSSLTNGYLKKRQAEVKIKILNYSTCSAPDRQVTATPTIRHGLNVTRGYYPWHAAIFKLDDTKSEYICGGTLISSETVLTAAHCVHERSELISARTVLVRFDVTHLNVDGTPHLVHHITPHEYFNDDNFQNDIALLKLRTKVTFTDFIKPACLTNANFNIFDVIGYVAGFGHSSHLIEAGMPGRSFTDCKLNNKKFYDDYVIPDYSFCAGNVNGTTISKGDSGGAIVFPFSNVFYVRGIVSLAASDSRGRIDFTKYSLFTDIKSHYKWIVEKMDPSEINESEENETFFPKRAAVIKKSYLECFAPARQVTPNLPNVPRGYYPWHAAILKVEGFTNQYMCGGTLISSETVLTAAHCLYDRGELLSARTVMVRFDVTQHNVDGTAHRVKKINVHESYNNQNFQHDIAVLKLSTKVIFTDFIRPACVTNENFNIFNVVGSIAGFGQSAELHELHMTGRTFEECILKDVEFYHAYFNQDSNFCASNSNGTTITNGDSGAGLVFNHLNIFTVRGILSLAPARGILSLAQASSRGIIDSTTYAILTDIQIHYKWIVDQMDVSERNESSD